MGQCTTPGFLGAAFILDSRDDDASKYYNPGFSDKNFLRSKVMSRTGMFCYHRRDFGNVLGRYMGEFCDEYGSWA